MVKYQKAMKVFSLKHLMNAARFISACSRTVHVLSVQSLIGTNTSCCQLQEVSTRSVSTCLDASTGPLFVYSLMWYCSDIIS